MRNTPNANDACALAENTPGPKSVKAQGAIVKRGTYVTAGFRSWIFMLVAPEGLG